MDPEQRESASPGGLAQQLARLSQDITALVQRSPHVTALVQPLVREAVDTLARILEALQAASAAVPYAAMAAPPHQVSAARDQFQAEGAHVATLELFQGLVEAVPDAILVHDEAGAVVCVNAQAERLFGYTREELLRQPLEILLPERLWSHYRAHQARDVAQPDGRPMGLGLALAGRYKDGREFPVEIRMSPLSTRHGVLLISAVRDVTDRQHLENQLQAALHAKEELRHEVYHRIRNNLQVISSLFDLQAETVQEPRVRAILANSQQRLQALACIHDSLSQTDVGGHVDAAAYLEGLHRRLCAPYAPADARLTVRFHADPAWLEVRRAIACGLLLAELLANCFRHAFPAGQAGEIGVAFRTQPGSLAALTVRDTGVGLPAHLDVWQTASVGFQLVSMLTEELEGTLTLERVGGTTVTVTFSIMTDSTGLGR